jgi:Fe-S-cluster containining protein
VKKTKQRINWHERARVATNGIRFECQRCCKCCYGEVILSYWDVETILKNNQKMAWAIIPTTSPRYPQQGEFFSIMHTGHPSKIGEKGLCAYLEDNACRAYSGRPITCQTYPFSVEMKNKMKEKRKLPKRAPVFLDPKNSKGYVVVYDPECPGVGKGLEVNLDQIASLEFDNIAKVTETYTTELKNQINDLICSKEEKEEFEKYATAMTVFTDNRKIKDNNNVEQDVFIHISYNPKDTTEEDARKLSTNTLGLWKNNFPAANSMFINYTFPVGTTYGLISIYVGTIPIKHDLVTRDDLEQVFSALLISEELQKKSKTSVGFANVLFENGQWVTPS